MSTPERQSQAPLELRAFIDCIPGMLWSATPEGAVDYCNRPWLDFASMTAGQAEGWGWAAAIYPEDRDSLLECWRSCLASGTPLEMEARMRRFDGAYRWFLFRANPLRDECGRIVKWYGTNIDIEERKRKEELLEASELSWRQILDNIPGFVYALAPDGKRLYANRVVLDRLGVTSDEAKKEGLERRFVHPDDLDRFQKERRLGLSKGVPFDLEGRLLGKTGGYLWHLIQYNPLKDESGQIVRWYVTATDIDDQKRAEEKLRQSEQDLRTMIDSIRQPMVVVAPDGKELYANRAALDLTGIISEDAKDGGYCPGARHPDDVDRVRAERQQKLLRGAPFDLEMRVLSKNGQYRWQVLQYEPFKDDIGRVIRWYCTATDIDDQKKAEERLRNENLVLREEIDRTSMFEEIVGSSKPMSQVLRQVERVAPSDSTVLILGETGTGKELIARALHRRSKRATRAFVRVNCAAIPESLVASELFGHEKGAFTGALQRRVGRFETADGGSLFLDEVGELPMDTQIALLRVLQEREVERVGSNRTISIDVRVIAATNRDLAAAVAAGTFRRDLFYRLNVFPIAIPPLRDRPDDIPLLLEYFVARFAKSSGKNIRHISEDTLRMMREYGWPGNIRELQNVVERAVILTESDTFFVDENWLNAEPIESTRPQEGLLTLADRELEMIEAALAECDGRISGPTGAAAKLGIPRQTLESKLRRLGIGRNVRYVRKRPIAP